MQSEPLQYLTLLKHLPLTSQEIRNPSSSTPQCLHESKLAASGIENFGKLAHDGPVLDAEYARKIAFVICANPEVSPERRQI